jgi:phosphate transport system protein
VRHFEEELDDLRRMLLEMSGLVEAAIYRSVLAVVRGEENQAQQVFENESKINQMQLDIDGKATRLLALDQPVAKDLRFIAAALKINNDFERMGDEAVNIAERAVSLIHQVSVNAPVDIPHMANLVESMVRKALDCFVKTDAEMARSVLVADDMVDELWDSVVQELVGFMQTNPTAVPQCVNLMFVARNLERIADHATNIAEDVIYLAEGVDVRHHSETTSDI